MIRAYLSYIIDNHKTPTNLRVHSNNTVTDYKTWYEEWKIQLTKSINFISSKDCDETRNMHAKSDTMEIIIGSETNDIMKNFVNLFCKNIRKDLKNQWEEASLVLIVLIYHIKTYKK